MTMTSQTASPHMSDSTGTSSPQRLALPVNKIEITTPFVWLKQGLNDITANSLFFGIVMSFAGFMLTYLVIDSGYIFMAIPLIAGFMLVGPFLAVGLYEISRRKDEGIDISLKDAITAMRHHPGQLAFMGLAMTILLMAWIRVATLIFALFYGQSAPNPNAFLDQIFTHPDLASFLIVGNGIGALFALAAFSISVISFPLLLERKTNIFTALATSAMSVRENFVPMMLWAAILVTLTAIGIFTAFIGLIFLMPLMGHASWRAYKDLVKD